MAEINMDDLKPNSFKYRQEADEALKEAAENQEEQEKKVEKVITGKVTSKKRSLGRRFIDIFFKDGASPKEIRTYLLEDVIVPAVLDNITEIVNSSVEMIFFGEARRRNKKSSGGSGNNARVNYGGYFNSGDNRRDRPSRSVKEQSSREILDDFIFDSRADAEQVLDDMRELLDRYQQVTVADYLDMLGKTSVYTDNKFGWTDLSRVQVSRVRGGYRIDLPRESAL